jgi:hypothetical protein
MWVSITVVLVSLFLLGYIVIVIGQEGYPMAGIVGGILGLYGAGNEIGARKKRDRQDDER